MQHQPTDSYKNDIEKIKLVIQDTASMAKRPLVFWTGGKDSTLMLYYVLMYIPAVDVVFLDSKNEFDEIYDFIKEYRKLWNIKNFHKYSYDAPDAKEARLNKIDALNRAIEELEPDYVFVGIRWDEHEERAKETYISERETHTRVHPILHITESRLWEIMHNERIPYVDLYDKGYRSLGEKDFTVKDDRYERAGRDSQKEDEMQNLRRLGYF